MPGLGALSLGPVNYVAALRQGMSLEHALAETERGMLQAALDMAKGEPVEAARLLGIDPAKALVKIDEYRLDASRQEI